MTASPTVSLGIRGWHSDYTSEAIESVLTQGLRDVEIIVCDDSGELEYVCRRFRDPRVRYLRNASRLGPEENARRVLALARGEFVGLLDDDDRLLPGYLEAVLEPFEKDASLGVVLTNHYFDDGERLRPRQMPLEGGRYHAFLPEVLRRLPAPTSGTLMRRQVWRSGAERFPTGERPRFLWTAVIVHAAAMGWPFFYVDRLLIVYRVHQKQMSGENALMRESGVQLWDGFAFEDGECERLRRWRLADALLSRAALLLREGRHREALADLDRAIQASPDSRGWRSRTLQLLARRPWLLPVAIAAHRAVRPRVAPTLTRRTG